MDADFDTIVPTLAALAALAQSTSLRAGVDVWNFFTEGGG
jgi:hypothetical protein